VVLSICFAFIIGVLFGNYASTALFRLPRNIPISGYNTNTGKAPHCSTCEHKLKFYEYLPVLSWVSTKGKCNYCGVKINPKYTILEVATALLALSLYLYIGSFNEEYILLLCAGTLLNLSLFLFNKKNSAVDKILLLTGFIGGIYRTLTEETILNWVFGLSVAYFIWVSITMKIKKMSGNENSFLNLFFLAGVWLKASILLPYIVILLSLKAANKLSLSKKFQLGVIALYSLVILSL
jgi:prepilin signal peptidase PulO-like enzyme (type II secretory pathway)